MLVLLQFVYRLAFGLALCMSLTSHRQVTGGYYRNHTYVLLGLDVLAACLAWLLRGGTTPVSLWLPVTAGALCYLASVVWLYEKAGPGRLLLSLIAAVNLAAALLANPLPKSLKGAAAVFWRLDAPTGGLLLGATMAAMLLGHWYLNSPGMRLAPLQRLVRLVSVAAVLRGILAGGGLALLVVHQGHPGIADTLFLALRWASGIAGLLLLAWLTWQTLNIPNTQSATGILYVGVILTFIGELTSQLLSARLAWPV